MKLWRLSYFIWEWLGGLVNPVEFRKKLNRREFTKLATLLPLTAVSKSFASADVVAAPVVKTDAEPLQVHLFSKHLQFLNYKDLAEAAAEIGFGWAGSCSEKEGACFTGECSG